MRSSLASLGRGRASRIIDVADRRLLGVLAGHGVSGVVDDMELSDRDAVRDYQASPAGVITSWPPCSTSVGARTR
jgi:hypothetical protein